MMDYVWVENRRKFRDSPNRIWFIGKCEIIKVCLNIKEDSRQSSLTYLSDRHTVLTCGHRKFVLNNRGILCDCTL